MTSNIEGRVLELIARASHRRVGELRDETALQDLGINSMDVIILVFELEEELGITIDSGLLASLVTIGDVIQEVNTRFSASVG
jgi:acyl carrier protein